MNKPCATCPTGRRGFTIMEMAVALGILAGAMVLVAQIGIWSMRERARAALGEEMLETAANVLESARACPWDALTPAWGAEQHLPEFLAQRLLDGKMLVRVEPEPARPHTKRVTVEIGGNQDAGGPLAPVRMVGLFSARSAPVSGGKP